MGRVVRAYLAGILLCGGFVLLAACQAHTYNVRYEILGTASTIRATYTNATGAIEQRDVQGSWNLDLQADAGKFLTLRAANPTAEGTVRCRLLIDGQVFKEGESSGGFKFVDCSGMLPLPTPLPTAPRP